MSLDAESWYEKLAEYTELRQQLRQAELVRDEELASSLEAKLSATLSSIPELISRQDLLEYTEFMKKEYQKYVQETKALFQRTIEAIKPYCTPKAYSLIEQRLRKIMLEEKKEEVKKEA